MNYWLITDIASGVRTKVRPIAPKSITKDFRRKHDTK